MQTGIFDICVGPLQDCSHSHSLSHSHNKPTRPGYRNHSSVYRHCDHGGTAITSTPVRIRLSAPEAFSCVVLPEPAASTRSASIYKLLNESVVRLQPTFEHASTSTSSRSQTWIDETV